MNITHFIKKHESFQSLWEHISFVKTQNPTIYFLSKFELLVSLDIDRTIFNVFTGINVYNVMCMYLFFFIYVYQKVRSFDRIDIGFLLQNLIRHASYTVLITLPTVKGKKTTNRLHSLFVFVLFCTVTYLLF